MRLLTLLFLAIGSLGLARASMLSAIWANDGGDKVTQSELRATPDPTRVTNSIWDGATIRLEGAQNEVLSFYLVMEAGAQAVSNLSLSFPLLTGPAGYSIGSDPSTPNDLFTWTNRNIELFFVRYLSIKGLSRLSYESYDERHIPERLRRPWSGPGIGEGGWTNRPDHNAFYPDIAVPIELIPSFHIAAGQNQGIWVDVYIPKEATPGVYTGQVTITENNLYSAVVPVTLRVRNFALPDIPSAKTMVFLGYSDIDQRYLNEPWPMPGSSNEAQSRLIRDRHFLLAHRHKVSLIDANPSADVWLDDRPRPEWRTRLSGALFSRTNGYAGPGEDIGNNVFSIGTYGTWSWPDEGETGMWRHADAWVSWFASNAPATEFFLYLIDESTNYMQTEQWAHWIGTNPSPGSNLPSFATLPLPDAVAQVPSLNIPASALTCGISNVWESALLHQRTQAQKRVYLYNGRRPATGSFATEDDGVALRVLAWAQFKKRIDRWFFWESTYYNNYQGGMGQTRVFQSAFTFGGLSSTNGAIGETGWNYSNGDGVLFYPGTDRVFPEDSFGLMGPMASLRLKQWRRGLQDVDYLALAASFDPNRVGQIVDSLIPRILWEYGVSDTNDPTWVRTDISWPTNPDRWEAARHELGTIVETSISNHVLRMADPPTPVTLTWNPLGPAYRYTIEVCTSLANDVWELPPGNWPTNSTQWIDSNGWSETRRFYRLKAVSP